MPILRLTRARAVTAVVAGALAVAACAAASPAPPDTAIRGRIQALTRRIGEHPREANLYFRRAELYYRDGDFRGASDDYARATELDPNLPGLTISRALFYLSADHPATARSLLDGAVERDPRDGEALVLRARASEALGEPRQALADLDRGIPLIGTPRPEPYLQRMRILVLGDSADLERALVGLDQGIGRLGSVYALESPAIEIEMRLRHWDRALARLDSIAPRFERREQWLARRGDILFQAGRRSDAIGAYHDALGVIEALPPEKRGSAAVRGLESRLRRALAKPPPAKERGSGR